MGLAGSHYQPYKSETTKQIESKCDLILSGQINGAELVFEDDVDVVDVSIVNFNPSVPAKLESMYENDVNNIAHKYRSFDIRVFTQCNKDWPSEMGGDCECKTRITIERKN